MFVDEVKVFARAGHGGRGCVAFLREAFRPKGGPIGGDGGRGGDVLIEADHDQNNLVNLYHAPRLIAPNGGHGLGKGMTGRGGTDRVFKVPCGTVVWRLEPDPASERGWRRGEVVADLTQHGQRVVLCKGGRGGFGNRHFATARRQTPRFAQPGEPGEQGDFLFELRIIADVGLVGYPNAGKSTLLAAVSRARPRIAPYPFTTLHPQVGMVEYEDWHRVTLCDVPGLIEGAHANAGLGHQFLRHIRRCRALALILDMAGIDGRKPWEDYRQLLRELEHYDPALLERPRLLVANKMDETDARANLRSFKRRVPRTPILEMAAGLGEGLEPFRNALRELVPTRTPPDPVLAYPPAGSDV